MWARMSRAGAQLFVQLEVSMDRSRLAGGRHWRKCFLLRREGQAEGIPTHQHTYAGVECWVETTNRLRCIKNLMLLMAQTHRHHERRHWLHPRLQRGTSR
jgi:hypothetical protein